MARVEKTVFISYRRADISWALLVYKYLTIHDYDVFFDFTSISSGDFEQIIISNIKARAHFLIILTPSALDRCNEPEDWLRREIETAIREKRNIIPMFFGGFSFGDPSLSRNLTGRLAAIKNYNGLEVPASYFDAAMERLRNQYLNITLDAVLHPVSDEVQKVVDEQQVAANQAMLQKIEIEKKPRNGKQNKLERTPVKEWAANKISAQPKLKPEKDQVFENLPDRLKFNGIEFCHVPAGPFLMGSDKRKDKEADDDENNQHAVDIPYDYWLARFPITNEQYEAFAQAQSKNPISQLKHKRNHPVVEVSWHDAMAYCRWLNDLLGGELPDGFIFCLPTEANWEKAARGTDGRIYPWGNSFDKSRCNTDEGGKGSTNPVGAYSLDGDSPFGCADMSGNVWEWTHSLYKPYPYRVDDGREDEESGESRILRGGSFNRNPRYARCAYRDYYYPVNCFNYIGFRVCISPE